MSLHNPSYNLAEYLKGRSVMVVEPSRNYRDSMKRFLANLKINDVLAVSSVEEANRALLTAKVGFFIAEWVLDGVNGLEFCRAMRKKKGMENVPFLLITTENMRSDVILASEAGIDGYLLKPFSYEDFVKKTKSIVQALANPDDLNVILRKAQDALNQDKDQDAEELFRQALNQKATSARALVGLGVIALGRDQSDVAIEYFEKAIFVNKEFIDAYSKLIDAYEYTRNEAKVLEIAEQAYAISPDNPRYTLILARSYFEKGSLPESEKFFRKTLLLSPKLATAYKGLGNVYYQKAEFDKAIKNFQKALDIEPADISLLNSLGLSYVRKGLIVQGIDRYRIALQIDAFDWRVLFNLGYAYEKLGDPDKATAYYQRAIAVKPDFDKAERRLKFLASA